MKNFVGILILSIVFFSCTTEKCITIEENNLESAFILNSSSTFEGYYYLGSDNDFHYFVSKWKLKKDNYFKIKRDDLNVENILPKDSKEQKIDLVNENNNREFGYNKYYTLYLIN